MYLLLLVNINLEANNVSVLDFTLRESQLGLHELNHAGFDFLQNVFRSEKTRSQYRTQYILQTI